MIGKLLVVGVGLIGGSLALALRERAAVREVIGVGRTRANLDRARARGIIDACCTLDDDWSAHATDADVVFVATPVSQMPMLFRALAPRTGAHTVITDGGSTKRDVVAAAARELGDALPRFVAGHPIAGTEHSGADAAFATLFTNRSVILTPTSETDAGALMTVCDMWTAAGARVSELDPARHDAVFAAVSHAPHVLAFALVSGLAQRPDASIYFEHAASGFRDFTRLASSNAEMWRDICVANRDAVRGELAAFESELARIDALLAADDRESLLDVFARARSARDAWLARLDGTDAEGAACAERPA